MGKSHQKGWIVPRGKKWYGYFRRTVVDAVSGEPKTIAVPLVLGARSQMTKFEARDANGTPPGPEKAVRGGQLGAFYGALEDADLMAQGEDLQLKGGTSRNEALRKAKRAVRTGPKRRRAVERQLPRGRPTSRRHPLASSAMGGQLWFPVPEMFQKSGPRQSNGFYFERKQVPRIGVKL